MIGNSSYASWYNERRKAKDAPSAFNSIRHIDYEVDIPIEYWDKDASFIPDQAAARVAHMTMWQRLYDGNWRDFQIATPIRLNYHERACLLMGWILLAYPPEYSDSVTNLVGKRFTRMLNKAAFDTVVDTIRYGTGLYRLSIDERQRVSVTAPQPLYYYPADDERDVLLSTRQVGADEYVTMFATLGSGVTERREFKKDRSGRLSLLNAFTAPPFGDEKTWDVIDEETDGRDGLIIPVRRMPDTGDWGRGAYPSITLPALEINVRFSETSSGLTEQANARMLIKGGRGTAGSMYDPPKRPRSKDSQDRQEELDQASLNQWFAKKIKRLPLDADDAHYIEYLVQFGDSFEQVEKCERAIMAALGLPPEWHGLLRGEGYAPSGTSLKRQHIPTHGMFKSFHGTHIASLKRAVLTAGLLRGAPASQLQEIAKDKDAITWNNIFDLEEMDSAGEVDRRSADVFEETEDDLP